jgi:hypothetical protein
VKKNKMRERPHGEGDADKFFSKLPD